MTRDMLLLLWPPQGAIWASAAFFCLLLLLEQVLVCHRYPGTCE
jgi:hypothetical protein